MAELLYSVWALAPPDHPGLAEAAQHLRQLHGGPHFDPHVIGGFTSSEAQAVANLQSLARSLAPTKYKISGVGHGRTYFQSVFLTIDPVSEVMEVNLKAKKAFGLPEADYMPHLSLVYGDLKDEDKLSAKATVEEKYPELIMINSEFVVDKLSLYETDTEDRSLKSWKKVAECALGDA